MKAFLNCAFLLLLSTLVHGQVRNLVTDRIYIRDSFRLKDKAIYQISTDATFSSSNHKTLATQKAIQDFVTNQVSAIDSLVKAANASGLFTPGTIPYIDATGRMDARGFLEFGAMSAPSTPSAGVRVFADGSNRFSWKGVDGYVRTLNGTLTADRVYSFQNSSGTFGLLEATQNWTGINTFTPAYSGTGDLSGVGYGLRMASVTYTNTTTVASGTVPVAAISSLGGGVMASTNSGVVYTDFAVLNIEQATAGANSTFTRNWGVRVLGPGSQVVAQSSVTANDRAWLDNSGFLISRTSDGTGVMGLVRFPGRADGSLNLVSRDAITASINTIGIAQIMSNGMVVEIASSGNTILSSPHPSSILDINSIVKGFRFPRVTTAQRDAISLPATGLHVYNTTTNRVNYWNGTAWVELSSMVSGGLGSGRIVYTNVNGDLTSASNFLYSDATGQITLPAVTGIRGSSTYTHVFNAGGSSGSISFGFGQDPTVGVNRYMTIYQPVSMASGITSGPVNTIVMNPPYQWSLGTASPNVLSITPSINLTGTYVGTVRGLFYNPSIINSVGLSHIAIETTAGNVIFNGGNVGIGTSSPTTPLTVVGGITANSNGHRFGFLQINTSADALATGQGIKVTGVDSEFQFQGTGRNVENTFSLAVYNSKTTPRGLLNTNPTNNFFRIYGGFQNPNTYNTVGTILHISPVYNIATFTGAKITGVYYNPTLTSMVGVATHNAWESTIGNFVINGGSVGIGVATPNESILLELNSTSKGFLIPRGTDANIASIASPPLATQMFSTTSERINIKRTDGFYQVAYIQDVKRDSTYKTVNANLDLSGLTTTFKTRFHTVRIKTIVTVAAAGNNTITMPVPSADLLGINFKVSAEDTSGDGDISVISFGTDGSDGYLYNNDGTFGTSLNAFPGLGIYMSVAWCEVKSAYRWELQ